VVEHVTAPLFHYTCTHGRVALGVGGTLQPPFMQGANPDRVPDDAAPLLAMVWATDLSTPRADALGLTRTTITCDRTLFRYTVPAAAFNRWGRVRSQLPTPLVDALELARGAEPAHWWVAFGAVEGAVYAPARDGPTRRA
jgi:hypothetical protein